MPADIIKFNKARKAKSRVDKEQLAIANRAKFGRTKEERAKESANDKLSAKRHAAMKLERARKPEGGPTGEGGA